MTRGEEPASESGLCAHLHVAFLGTAPSLVLAKAHSGLSSHTWRRTAEDKPCLSPAVPKLKAHPCYHPDKATSNWGGSKSR